MEGLFQLLDCFDNYSWYNRRVDGDEELVNEVLVFNAGDNQLGGFN